LFPAEIRILRRPEGRFRTDALLGFTDLERLSPSIAIPANRVHEPAGEPTSSRRTTVDRSPSPEPGPRLLPRTMAPAGRVRPDRSIPAPPLRRPGGRTKSPGFQRRREWIRAEARPRRRCTREGSGVASRWALLLATLSKRNL
jgi:hypothetical protein